MGARKKDAYSNFFDRNSELAFAVSSGARIAILAHLDAGHLAGGFDFQAFIDLDRRTINQHIQLLVRTGLIKGTYYGKRYLWEINYEREEELAKIRWAWNR